MVMRGKPPIFMKKNDFTAGQLISRISRSSPFHTYQHLFTNGFGLPLFLQAGADSSVAFVDDRRADFCLAVHPRSGCCGTCPLSRIPPLETLELRRWTGRCRALMHTGAAPVRVGNQAVAWLITGHVFPEGSERPPIRPLVRALRATRRLTSSPATLYAAYRRVPGISASDWERSTQLLAFIGVFLGSQLNSILIGSESDDAPEISRLKKQLREPLRRKPNFLESIPDALAQQFREASGMTVGEFDERCRLEQARREILAGMPDGEAMEETARRAGWSSALALQGAFVRYFHETPAEHRDRIARSESTLSSPGVTGPPS
jgi:hypothetical protein